MIQVVLYRKKCIGCNACVELAPEHWKMSRKDGKSVLLGAQQKKEYFILNLPDSELNAQQKASTACPAGLITVKKLGKPAKA